MYISFTVSWGGRNGGVSKRLEFSNSHCTSSERECIKPRRKREAKNNMWKNDSKKKVEQNSSISHSSNFHYRGLHIVVTFCCNECDEELVEGAERMENCENAMPPTDFLSHSSRDSNDKVASPHTARARNHEQIMKIVGVRGSGGEMGTPRGHDWVGKRNEHNLRNLNAPFIPSQSTPLTDESEKKMEIFPPLLDINFISFLFLLYFSIFCTSLPPSLIKPRAFSSFHHCEWNLSDARDVMSPRDRIRKRWKSVKRATSSRRVNKTLLLQLSRTSFSWMFTNFQWGFQEAFNESYPI